MEASTQAGHAIRSIDDAEVWLGEPAANNGVYALIGSRSRQNRRPAWAKSNWKSFIMAIAKQSAIGSAKQEGMAHVVAAIDYNRPQILLSPFLGVKALRSRVNDWEERRDEPKP